MVAMMMHQHQNHGNPPANSAAIGSIRSPHNHNHRAPSPSPLSLDAPCRIRLSDILPYDGVPMAPYIRAVDALSTSLVRHNAAVIELGSDDAALLRCALESARFYFRIRKGGRGVYTYRAGSALVNASLDNLEGPYTWDDGISFLCSFSSSGLRQGHWGLGYGEQADIEGWLNVMYKNLEKCGRSSKYEVLVLSSLILGFSKESGICLLYQEDRPLEDLDSSPPCMADIFRCMGRAARAALSAIARHLRLRSDVFNHLLDDSPLPANEASSSVLVATFSQISLQQGKGATGGGKLALSCEVEKGLLMLVSADTPGLQVCDPNGRWYQADSSLAPGDLLLLTGKALSQATAGLRPAASYRATPDNLLIPPSGGRISLAFRLMPQGNAILDCTPISAAGHVIPQSYVPISVSQFMDDLSAEEDLLCNHTDNAYVPADNLNREPSLRSVLSDPLSLATKFNSDPVSTFCTNSLSDGCLLYMLDGWKYVKVWREGGHKLSASHGIHSGLNQAHAFVLLVGISSGAFLEDAMLVSCGHSFGGLTLRKVIETSTCSLCNSEIEAGSLIPNHALRAAALAVKQEDDRRLFHNAALRKRRKEASEHRENGDITPENGSHRGVQYPFSVNEKVVIKGNRRTPDKFVGKEAIITSQCLNGWYLLKIIESGENVRLQYRSLRKIPSSHDSEDRSVSQPVQNSSS
ncbi:hypothetical protein DH2020_003909 [Rehmannia glutinosa]|uniref:PUB 62/63 C-terminal domain-containing protein n=1 Tax=Rehmannia glutinosa TaxID=99300 RepID=A0ABR0XNA3_REHGL